MAVGMIDLGSADQSSTYRGDRKAPQIPYLDYYDAAYSAREESRKQQPSHTSTGEEFTAPVWNGGNRAGRQGKEAFDKIQEEMKKEAGQEVPPEDTSLAAREGIGKDEETKIEEETDLWLLLMEQTSCSYPSETEEGDEIQYHTYYAKEEIYCRGTDASGYEWEIPLENESQYEKIIEFLGQFDPEANLRFACHENFWRDFLDGTLDLDGFMEFMDNRVIDGIPNYVNMNEYGMWIDTEAAKYAKYMNKPGLFLAK